MYTKGGLAAMFISTIEFITITKGKPADSPSIGGWAMEYATGDVQKGPVLLESPLKGIISNSKLHPTIMMWMQ